MASPTQVGEAHAPADDEILPGSRVIVIDDDYAMRLSCRQILAKSGYQVDTFENGTLGMEAVLKERPDLVVVDLKMPGISGMDVINRVREADPDIVIVVITGYPTIGSAVDAIKAGAFDFLPKPFTPDELRLVVKRAMGRRGLLIQSQRLRMERELMKRRFMTFVSHQVKAPLSAIRQYLDMMKRLEDSPTVREKREDWLDRCLNRTDDLIQLVEDWLTLSRVECADLVHRRECVDIVASARGILRSYEPAAAEKSVQLQSQLPDEGLHVAGDPGCVVVLLDNLIVNAIKYNRPGGSVSVNGTCAQGEVVVDVVDTGQGIPERYHPFIFDEFFRVQPEGSAAAASGTGLGLPICKKIVTEMGGEIEVHSEVGAGSTFRVRLPAYPMPVPPLK